MGPAVIIIGSPLRRLKFLPPLIQDSNWLTSRCWRGWWTMSMHITWFHLPNKSINVNINCLLVSGYHSLQKSIYCCQANKQTTEIKLFFLQFYGDKMLQVTSQEINDVLQILLLIDMLQKGLTTISTKTDKI
jgi:hypothetical protein